MTIAPDRQQPRPGGYSFMYNANVMKFSPHLCFYQRLQSITGKRLCSRYAVLVLLLYSSLPGMSQAPPVITLPAGETICDGATTNINPVSSEPGTTYSWTVVQTGVTGASAGTGTSITQTLTNTGTTPGTAAFTITPTANGVDGAPVNYTVTIQPVSNVLYVDALNGNDANCGNAWSTAFKTLSAAMGLAANHTIVDSILVAEGTYYPTGDQNGTDRNTTFLIMRGKLKLFGGYPNGGGARDITAHPTVLSGDIGVMNDSLDNSYHVMVIVDIPAADDSLVIDGFTITKGTANRGGPLIYGTQNIYQGNGGGIYIHASNNGKKTVLRNLSITDCAAISTGGGLMLNYGGPYIQNCTFINNYAYIRGGAMANEYETSPYFIDCRFINNIAGAFGGGVILRRTNTRPEFVNCHFTGNKSLPLSMGRTFGGAMYIEAYPQVTITNCIFSNNSATAGGGAINSNLITEVNITHSVFENNEAVNTDGSLGTGGALQLDNGGIANVDHSVFINNRAGGTLDDGGGAIMIYGGTMNCTNITLLNNNTSSTSYANGNGITNYAGAVCNFKNSIAWGTAATQVHNLGILI